MVLRVVDTSIIYENSSVLGAADWRDDKDINILLRQNTEKQLTEKHKKSVYKQNQKETNK